MKKDLNSILLTRQELHIMKIVWDRGAATVRQVCDAMAQRRPTAYTTVLTLMGILEDKGALAHTRSGRTYVYKPVLSRREAARNQVRDLLTRFFDGRPENLIACILEDEATAPEQLDAVRNLLASKRKHVLI
jgi:predicted transcriptional regulator